MELLNVMATVIIAIGGMSNRKVRCKMTGTVKCNIKIHNMPDGFDASYGKYVVCRVDAGDFWYYGAYDTKHRADYVALEVGNGIVFELARHPYDCAD